MTIYQWLCLFGVPAILAGIFKFLHSLIKKNKDDTVALKSGIQALLRSQMIADYNKYNEKGYAPVYARENFETVGSSITLSVQTALWMTFMRSS